METRFDEWCRQRGWDARQFTIHSVDKVDEGRVVVQFSGAPPETDFVDALQGALDDAWGVTTAVTLRPMNDMVAELKHIFAVHGTAFAAMLKEDSVSYQNGAIACCFPNVIAQRLFHKWGGEARLRQLWPTMPSWQESVADLPERPPEEAVSVAVRTGPTPQDRVGRGAPDGPAVPLVGLPESGAVVVEGLIIQRDLRVGRDSVRHWSWVITDHQGAVRVRLSERRGQALPFVDDLWPRGSFCRVKGTVETDKFTEERLVRLKDGGLVTPPDPITPDARPRFELHVHSKMSAMDALIAPKDAFDWASKVGIPAMAILDHGVVQTYPEAETLARSTGVRALFGVELNMVDTTVRPLLGVAEGGLKSRRMVVLDVETTGLSPRRHEVIEIGAVEIEDGTIGKTFHRMVAPTRTVSQATQEITGIKPMDLEGAPDADEVFRDFFRFAEGAVLVAHNARFDMGFLRKAHEKIFPDKPWDGLVLDTLGLARTLLPGLKSYGLGPLSQHLKIPLSQHHRALADAEATSHLALKLMDLALKEHPDFDFSAPHAVAHTVGRPTPVVILLKDQAGVQELYRLISASHLESFHRVPRVPRHLIEAGRAHWVIGAPIHGGEVSDALFRCASTREWEELARFYDYWEVTPPDGLVGLQEEGQLDGLPAVEGFIKDLIVQGDIYAKPVVAVSDAHVLRPEDQIFRDILAQTAKGELHDRHDHLFLRTGQEMEQGFGFLGPETRDRVIYEAPAHVVGQLGDIKPVPDGLFSPKLPEAERVVSELPYQRAQELYGDELPDIVNARLDKEVRSIVSNGFSSIYYIAHQLVQKSLSDGYLVGSRGSVGSSLVATFLNITEVNPLPPHYRCPRCRHTTFVEDERVGSGFDLPVKPCPSCGADLVGDGQDIPFETFLGFEGDKVPDIDLNFSGEYQGEIHRYTEELFGRGHVFRAGTIATVAEKTAFGLVKAWARDVGRDLTPAEVEWLVGGVAGVKRTTGQHPGGLMVVPEDEDVHHFSPVQRPADDRTSEVTTTHFDYHAIEGRLLKLDLLGHDDPTMIRMLTDLTGIGPDQVPFQDAETMSLFRDCRALGVRTDEIGTPVGSLGIPEFGTRFVRQMLLDTRPETFAELIRISGLSHGTEVWTNNAQDLIRQDVAGLSEVIATRDDIMMYLLNRGLEPKAAFAISEAVRKGRGLKPEQEALMKSHGVPGWYLESCRKISYLFPKAHAAAYVMMGWRIAWFKVHHPLAYYATYFSVRAGDFDPVVLEDTRAVNQALAHIEEKGNEASQKEKNLITVLELAREMMARNLRFYRVDLIRSHATRFLMENDGLLVPFSALSGVGASAAENIIAARIQSPFLSIDDLRQRAHVSKSVIDLLREHGALEGLGETSQLGFF